MEERKEALLREASESNLVSSTLRDKLAQLDSIGARPYGTLHAVRIFSFLFFSYIYIYKIVTDVFICLHVHLPSKISICGCECNGKGEKYFQV